MKEEDKKCSGICPDFQKCLEVLRAMLDNEATEEEENYLLDHIDKCLFCLEQYEVEKEIRELIRTKIAKRPAPVGLAEMIKTKIAELA